MFSRLNVNITLNLIFLLFLSMVLIDAVVIRSMQNTILQDEISEGEFFLSVISQYINDYDLKTINSCPDFKNDMDILLSKSDFSCAFIMKRDHEEIYFGGESDISKHDLVRITSGILQSGKQLTRLSGSTWGVFWKQEGSLIISAPIIKKNTIIAGVSLVFNLQKIYGGLRQTQYAVSIYIVINTLILTAIGVYRLSKLTVKPIKKLVESAESYTENDKILFLSEKAEGNEFSHLSKALNQMVYRISMSKEELRSTVRSLEKANIDLMKAQNDIINAEKLASVGRLSAGIAHEIGNPIAIIIGYLELIKRDDISESERKEFVIRTENEVGRINTIIRQLLNFSKPSSGDPKIFSVHELIEDIVIMFQFQPLTSNITITTSLLAKTDSIKADPAQLRQVFLNLMINAADAIRSGVNNEKEEITISTFIAAENINGGDESHEPMIVITFRDNGVGISDKHMKYIFDPFFTTKSPGKGTGLGLSVCFMIIEGIGGKIQAFSKKNEDTEIVIHLPIQKNNAHCMDSGD